jgi:ATP-dependent 26S proteasome regulatory subunit
MSRASEREVVRHVMSPVAASAVPRVRGLDAALAIIDDELALRLSATEREQARPQLSDDWHGFVASSEDVRHALSGSELPAPMSPLAPRIAALLATEVEFARLRQVCRLNDFQVAALMIAVLPDLDLRYERVFAFLQNDPSKRRASVDLLLGLLCADRADRRLRRAEFAPTGTLRAGGLIDITEQPVAGGTPLLARSVKVDEQVVRFLLADPGLDARLLECAALDFGQTSGRTPPARQTPEFEACRAAIDSRVPLWLHGPRGVGKARLAAQVAQTLGLPLLRIDCARIPAEVMVATLSVARREAALRDALLFISDAELSQADSARFLDTPLRLILASTQSTGVEFLGSVRALELRMPDVSGREGEWRNALKSHGLAHAAPQLVQLARRFRFTPAQIAAAAADAARRDNVDVFAAARAQCSAALGSVATKLDPRADWSDLVLPDDAIAQLRELCARADTRERVFEEWGFGARSSRGRGTAALFAGGSGTGKTLAADVLANSLGLDLWRIDLARVVSKYIGETEKNLEIVFRAAEGANAILLFDEADALFGKRSDVKDAHDRYANVEVAYLLQRMEDYEGIAILATNLADHLDKSFARRIAFRVHFPLPDASARERIWTRAWPPRAPLDAEVDCAQLARDHKLAGGNIRNVTLRAAFIAAEANDSIRRAHVRHALLREYQNLGRISELGADFSRAGS